MLSNTLIKLNKYPTDLKDFPFNEFNLIETSEFPQESIGNRPLLQDKQKIPTPLETKAFSKETEPKNHCNWSRSQCLKLYCECFAKGLICNLLVKSDCEELCDLHISERDIGKVQKGQVDQFCH